MLTHNQKIELFYSLVGKSKSFSELLNIRKELCEFIYQSSINLLTEDERNFIQDPENKDLIDSLDKVNIHYIITYSGICDREEMKKSLSNYYGILYCTIIDSNFLNCKDYQEEIKNSCNENILDLKKILGLSDDIVIPNLANGLEDVDYLLNLEKEGKFDFKKWIELLASYCNIKEKVRSRLSRLEEFINLEFLTKTELKKFAPSLYEIIKEEK